jgi:hypothetical protein
MRCKTAELANRNPRIPKGEKTTDDYKSANVPMFQSRTLNAKHDSHANKRNGGRINANQTIEKNKQTDRCRANKGNRGDNKCGGSVVQRIVGKLTGGLVARTQISRSNYPKVLKPDYCKARLLEIGVGRRFWQSSPSPENARTFYVRVVQPLRRLQRRGVVETLQEITATDDRTPIAVEIIGQVDLTKVSKQQGHPKHCPPAKRNLSRRPCDLTDDAIRRFTDCTVTHNNTR